MMRLGRGPSGPLFAAGCMNLLFTYIISRLKVVSFSSIITINEFEELGFDSLVNSMVVVMPTTAIALAIAKEWFLNRNKTGGQLNNTSEVNMKTDNHSSNFNNNLTLKTAIGTVLKVAYDTTIGIGVGKLLAAPQVSAR
ncbi:hypothetical protein [Pseudoxanthomonas sp. OG2]|uniref:hypothetical protein n=1 Tax=Pseudoxanthomonas sp. OG2 TaxID=2587011 RepID=UPI00160E918A|nr:hypothetical protein [Pseudoxanthomonas sp. OG2]MBB3277296.1 hypothetical protein [Pseudoxanthomonas sp. OG2]